MTEEERQERLRALDWEENRTKMHLQLYVQIPEVFANQGKEWLNNQINEALDKLRAIQRERKLLLENPPLEK